MDPASTSKSEQPDSHTRRYDRQLRLWAASGQQALELSRVLVISGSATSTSILKNLVLPGIGQFTILDSARVTPQDAGNNFFLHRDSIGKSRAEESVQFLLELNDSVKGSADTSDLASILDERPQYLKSFTLVISHNLRESTLKKLSSILWGDVSGPPLIVVRSAGFLAEFSIQFHEHTIMDSHTDDIPSYRLDNAFPALAKHALELDFDALDVTDHAHIPYFIILVRALHDWKQAHGGKAPEYKELKDFKAQILCMKKKDDEENFDEAVAQVFKAYQKTTVPSEIRALFSDPSCVNLDESSSPFFVMLHALDLFTHKEPYTLPLSPKLPDIKSDTVNYIHLQGLYKAQANAEKAEFTRILEEVVEKAGVAPVPSNVIDEFVRNSHQLKILKGKQWDQDDNSALLEAISTNPAQVGTHLALSALFAFEAAHERWPIPGSDADLALSQEWIDAKLLAAGWNEESVVQDDGAQVDEAATGPQSLAFKEHVANAMGEIIRAPTADLPTTAALLGGFVAQEAIKLITRQYVPINGICVIDLISSTTGTIKI